MRSGIGIRKCLGAIGCVMGCAAMILLNPMKADAAVSKADKAAYQAVFDADFYYNTYPDVAAAFGKDQKALFQHFTDYGIAEGRNANADFNPQAYRNRYKDLRDAYGNNMASYCEHYVNYGIAEGRDGSAVNFMAEVVDEDGGKQIGTYTTSYKANIPRAKNVELAAQRINGVVLQPGDSFSFSQTILPRTSENGYVEAPVIVNKKYTKGMGGGVCQVSSTLYAAMLNAGLPATERHPHSLAVDYIPKDMDATISGTALDLRFDNTYSQNLKIKASAEKGTLTVSLVLMP